MYKAGISKSGYQVADNQNISTARCPVEKSEIGVNQRSSAVNEVEKTKPNHGS